MAKITFERGLTKRTRIIKVTDRAGKEKLSEKYE